MDYLLSIASFKIRIMNRIKFIYLICCLVLAVGCETEFPEQNIQDKAIAQYVEGAANVLFSDDLAAALEEANGSLVTKSLEVNAMFEQLGVTSVCRLFPHAGEFEPRTRKAGLHRWHKITYNQDVPLTKAQEGFHDLPGVEKFEPERRIKFDASFNDPKLGVQWHYANDGSISSEFMTGADINVTDVWNNYTVGCRSVTVAVIDSGIDYEHEDIADNYIGGKNFGTGGKVTPDDHGTHVAGTIAAVNNNGIGVAGIAGGDAAAGIKGVGILGCQIFSGGLPAGGVEAIKWAADNGANIANNSWGYVYDTEEEAKNAEIPSDLADAIDYFIEYAGCDNEGKQLPDSPMKGGVIFFSAGNDAWKYNPIGEYEPVISVGSIGPDMTRAYYSCYGDWVDIAAPGGDAYISKGMVYSTIVGNKYDYMQGTSMSCPHVTGVAALIASYFGGPGFTNDMLLERLLGGANKDILPSSAKIGPLVDAMGAFTAGGTIAPEKVEDFTFDVVGNKVTINVEVTADEDDLKTFEYIVFVSEDKSLLDGIDPANVPEGVKVYRYKVGQIEVGQTMEIAVPDCGFEKEYHFAIVGCDYSLNYSEVSPVKTIMTEANNAPEINVTDDIQDIVLKAFETRTIAFVAKDPEGDNLTIALTEKVNGVSVQKTDGNNWTVTINAKSAGKGIHQCVIKATDIHGLEASFSLSFEVLENQTPAMVKKIEDVYVEGIGEKLSFNLDEYFSDPDGEPLRYKLTEGNRMVAKSAITDNSLSIDIVGYGSTAISIAVTDASNKTCSADVKIIVKNPENLVELYPIPVTDVLNVRTGKEAETEIVIKSVSGHIVHESKGAVSAFEPAAIDMSACAPGQYVVSVTFNGNVTEKLITKI